MPNFDQLDKLINLMFIMRGSSHIQSVLIGVKYRDFRQTLDVSLLAAISIGQIQSKPIYKLVTCIPSSPLVTVHFY